MSIALEPNVSPVVIEIEVMPAVSIHSDAVARLGERLRSTNRTIMSSIAVRVPLRLRKYSGAALHRELSASDDLEFALYTGTSPTAHELWPRESWIRGSVMDLSVLAQFASIPPDVIESAVSVLVEGVTGAAGILEEIATSHPAAVHRISEELKQEDGEQTRRMAMTILANAFVFHENLAGGASPELADVRSIEQIRSSRHGFTKSEVLAEWRKILRVNYWPIFEIARRILEAIPSGGSKLIISGLAETAERLVENRLMRSHDLTGAVFQKLIADRKFLALLLEV